MARRLAPDPDGDLPLVSEKPGAAGVNKAIEIFRTEIDLVMAQIGCPSLAELGPDCLWRDDWTANR